MEKDTYRTIARPAEINMRERSSRFIAYAWPIKSEEEANEHLDALRKEFYDATHHCFAWRLGPTGEDYRENDDGEPSGTAGRPILGQLRSYELTDILVVVVRYFGGTKLGVPGLISAYRESAKAVIEESRIVTRTIDVHYRIYFPYLSMNDVMTTVKDIEPKILDQQFDNNCQMDVAIRSGSAEELRGRLESFENVEVEELTIEDE